MHDEVLSKAQSELLPLMSQFRREFYLVGGTAIALHIGHRRSVDFDMFKLAPLRPKKILDAIEATPFKSIVTRRVAEQLNLVVNGVKLTFFQFPFKVTPESEYLDVFRMPSLLSLAAMKAYALGRRSKWKDYVDLYFLLSGRFSLPEVSAKATEMFGELFSEKLFRAQLSYFEDVDYTEEVEYIIDSPPSDELVRESLVRISVGDLNLN